MQPEAKQFYDEIITSFKNVTDKIGVYYKAVGGDKRDHGCGRVNELEFRQPGMGIDFVPTEARDGLTKMAEEAGIAIRRSNGGGGEGAYFHFPKDGLNSAKLDALGTGIEAEVARLKGPSFMEQELLKLKQRRAHYIQ